MRSPIQLQEKHLQINKKRKTVKADRVNLADIIDIFPCIKKLTSLQRKTKSIGQQAGYC